MGPNKTIKETAIIKDQFWEYENLLHKGFILIFLLMFFVLMHFSFYILTNFAFAFDYAKLDKKANKILEKLDRPYFNRGCTIVNPPEYNSLFSRTCSTCLPSTTSAASTGSWTTTQRRARTLPRSSTCRAWTP